MNRPDMPNPVIRILISVSSLLLIGGFGLSLMLFTIWATWRAGEGKHEHAIDQLLAKTAEDRRRFLRRLDHELKNPLMAMRAGLANFANAPTATARQSALATVEGQTVRLSKLTSDLRKIAELENRSLDWTKIDLEQLLDEAVSLVRETPDGNRRIVRLLLPQAPWPLPSVCGDWDLVFLAIYNLLNNALKFTQPGDTIEVRGREERGLVSLDVADTGPGISDEDLPHVWEELYRGQAGRTVPGSGLGMALVRAIAERHQGHVSIQSKEGRGTVVTIHLPINAQKCE
jgi:two-component system OmpR family sensor kinase